MDLRNKLKECTEIARENAVSFQSKFTTYFDLKAADRKLEIGDETLVLLPDSSNKLLVSWKGPYTVIRKINRVNYALNCNGSTKVYHINLLKKYVRRATIGNASVSNDNNNVNSVIQQNVFSCAHAVVMAVVLDENVLNVHRSLQ